MMNKERARLLIEKKKSKVAKKRMSRIEAAIQREEMQERKREEQLNAGCWTVSFEGGGAVERLDSFEDCLKVAQETLDWRSMDWEESRWRDDAPPLGYARFFDIDTKKTVATIFYDYK